MKQKVTVIGEGAWGTAIATVLAHNNCDVSLWCNDSSVVETIEKTRINQRYAPGFELSKNIVPTASIEEALSEAEIIFEAIPVKFLRCVLQKSRSFVKNDQIWVALSKGIEQETLLFPNDILKDVFGAKIKSAICVGPSFAQEVMQKKFTAINVAATDPEVSSYVKDVLKSNYFKVYTTSDVIGLQVASALKNVIALGVGILDGASAGENAKAFLLTQALNDLAVCTHALGGQDSTVYGLSGIGDLILTCEGGLSRNVMVGKYFGSGESIEKIISQKGVTPEGFNTVKSVIELAERYSINLPVCQGIYDMLFNSCLASDFLRNIS